MRGGRHVRTPPQARATTYTRVHVHVHARVRVRVHAHRLPTWLFSYVTGGWSSTLASKLATSVLPSRT